MVSSNTLLSPTIIAKEALMQLDNNMVMGANVHRQYKKEFAKVGTAVTIRKPNKFRATATQARSNTDISESSATFTVATQAHVSWAFSSVELTMTIEEYSERYIKPAAAALANYVDAALCGLYDDVHNCVGTPGTTPSTFANLGAALQRLDEESVPNDMRKAIFNPAGHWSMADGLKGIFNETIAKEIQTKGYLGRVGNAEIYMDQNIKIHTTGTFTTGCSPQVKSAASSGATLYTKGWKVSVTDVVKAGDVFTVEGVYATNSMSGDSTGVLRQFVVTADADSDSSGEATLSIAPTIDISGAGQNCSAALAANAVITMVGSETTGYPQNLVFHSNAFGLVSMPLEMPANVWGARETYNNVAIRVVKQYDIEADEEIIRLDILFGVLTLYPELACRLVG